MSNRPIDAVMELSKSLGRDPTLVELKRSVSPQIFKQLIYEYGTFSNLIEALHNPNRTGDGILNEARALRKYTTICSRKEQIQGFFRHVLDLEELFEKAGNPKSLKMIAQPDTHVKFMHRPSVNAFLKFVRWYDPHVFMIMGDFADCEGLAHWDQSTLEPRRIVPEMRLARSLLAEIGEHSPNVSTRIFLEGNHEYWIQMALLKQPELFDGLDDLLGIEVSVKTLMDLDKFGYNLFPLNNLVRIGKAHFTHGLYTVQHHAKKHLDVFKGNLFYGHLHDIQTHNQTSLEGNMEAASLGCLCRLDAKFLRGAPNNWVNAFGIFEFLPDGSYTWVRPNIINGVFSFCGQVFDGNGG